MTTSAQSRGIHALVRALQWTDEQYRELLAATYQVTSSAELSTYQAARLMDALGEAAKEFAASGVSPDVGSVALRLRGERAATIADAEAR